uniref:BAAT_C domain-containing protein n=1 Tax=Steinernema glaseri TaxID=37863 RepID=A0A1I7YJI9_9BILA
MWDRILDEESDEVAKYRIPLDRAPQDVAFMIVTGELDETQPYKRINVELVERLKKAGRRVQAEWLSHSGHMLEPPHMPQVGVAYTPPSYWAQGGDQYLQCVEQRRLWPKMIAFLRETIPLESQEKAKL